MGLRNERCVALISNANTSSYICLMSDFDKSLNNHVWLCKVTQQQRGRGVGGGGGEDVKQIRGIAMCSSIYLLFETEFPIGYLL